MSREVRDAGAIQKGGPEPQAAVEEEEEAPTGTLFFMMIFLLLMVGLWVTVYWMLLSR